MMLLPLSTLLDTSRLDTLRRDADEYRRARADRRTTRRHRIGHRRADGR